MTLLSGKQLLISYDRKRSERSLSIEDYQIKLPLEKDYICVQSLFGAINYKDIQSCLGNPGITRRYPHRPGNDIAGRVILSQSSKFNVGDLVYSCTYPLGMTIPGTFATKVVSTSKFFNKIPDLFNPEKLMMCGTAGFTAGYACYRASSMIKKSNPRVLIAGATSSTGLFIASILNSIGIIPSILIKSGREEHMSTLIKYDNIFIAEECEKVKSFGLGRGQFDIVFDLVGGQLMYYLLSIVDRDGFYFCIGNAGGSSCQISLLPFFERGVNLIGINSENCIVDKSQIWAFIFSTISSEQLLKINTRLDFFDLPNSLEEILTSRLNTCTHFFFSFN